MKKHRLIGLAVLLATVLGAAVWGCRPRTVPLEECSEVYRCYADNEHVAAAFLKAFRVNDSVVVDVTLLEAKDSLGWAKMSECFNLPPSEMFEEMEGHDVVVRLAPKTNYAQTKDSVLVNNDVVSVSFVKKQVCVFNIEYEKQIKAVSIHQFEDGHSPINNQINNQ